MMVGQLGVVLFSKARDQDIWAEFDGPQRVKNGTIPSNFDKIFNFDALCPKNNYFMLEYCLNSEQIFVTRNSTLQSPSSMNRQGILGVFYCLLDWIEVFSNLNSKLF